MHIDNKNMNIFLDFIDDARNLFFIKKRKPRVLLM